MRKFQSFQMVTASCGIGNNQETQSRVSEETEYADVLCDFAVCNAWALEIDMTKIGSALFAAIWLSSGPALACGQAYSSRGYQMAHHSRAVYAVKDISNSPSANSAVVAPSKSATADAAGGRKTQATAAAECKEYSATVGYMISVPCAK